MLAGDPILEDCMWNSEPVVIYNFLYRVVFQVTFYQTFLRPLLTKFVELESTQGCAVRCYLFDRFQTITSTTTTTVDRSIRHTSC